MTQLVQTTFKTRLKGVLLLHLNYNLSTEMTLLVMMLVFINKFPWERVESYLFKMCTRHTCMSLSLEYKNGQDTIMMGCKFCYAFCDERSILSFRFKYAIFG